MRSAGISRNVAENAEVDVPEDTGDEEKRDWILVGRAYGDDEATASLFPDTTYWSARRQFLEWLFPDRSDEQIDALRGRKREWQRRRGVLD